MTDREKVENLQSIPHHKYENVGLDHLVMYTVAELERIGADLSFENVVVAALKLFPRKFSLPGFPRYPDGKRVHDSLFRCTYKDKKWLGGKTRQGFAITDRSRIFITEAQDLLSGETSEKAKTHSQTRRKELLLTELVSSPAYAKFTEGRGDLISESDLCYLLQGTLDSSPEILRQNLVSLKKFVEELERQDIAGFLDWLGERFAKFLCVK